MYSPATRDAEQAVAPTTNTSALHRRSQTAVLDSSASMAFAALIASARIAPEPSLRPLRPLPSAAPSTAGIGAFPVSSRKDAILSLPDALAAYRAWSPARRSEVGFAPSNG